MEEPKIAIVEGKTNFDKDFVNVIKEDIGNKFKEYKIMMFKYPKEVLDFMKKSRDEIVLVITALDVYFGDEGEKIYEEKRLGGEQFYDESQKLKDPPKLLVFSGIREDVIHAQTNSKFKNKENAHYWKYEISQDYTLNKHNKGYIEIIERLIDKKNS